MWQLMSGRWTETHVHIQKFNMSSLPEADEDLAKWLELRFVEKGALLENFYKIGYFQDKSEELVWHDVASYYNTIMNLV